jgi:hypothetical protein
MSIRIVVLGVLVAGSVPLAAGDRQQVDMELYMRWAQAQLVHYDVVADYSGQTPILVGAAKASVKDRFEVSFDYVPMSGTITGKPVFKNVVTTFSTVFEVVCAKPQVNGPYEHLDIVDTKPAKTTLELTIKRSFPSGALPGRSDTTGECGLGPVAAHVETLVDKIPAIPGMFFAMPGKTPTHIQIGEHSSQTGAVTFAKDGKTIVVDDTATNGWKYTYTVTIVE